MTVRVPDRETSYRSAATARIRPKVGRHVVSLSERAVTDDNGELVHLAKTEWELLDVLVRNPASHYLSQLRKELEPDPTRPRNLLTGPGRGDRFTP